MQKGLVNGANGGLIYDSGGGIRGNKSLLVVNKYKFNGEIE